MAFNLDKFVRESRHVAARLSSADLPGFLTKELKVPEGFMALVKDSSGERLVSGGGSARGSFTAVLVRQTPFKLEYRCKDLRSQDSVPVELNLVVEVEPRAAELDLAQLRDNLLVDDEELTVAGLHQAFLGSVRTSTGAFVAKRAAEALVAGDQRGNLYQHLREGLQKSLLETGFDLRDVRDPVFRSDEYEKIRDQKLQARTREESLEHEKRLEVLRKELDKEVLLKDLEARDQVDRARKEQRVKRYEEIRERMGADDLKALVMMLDDDNQRARLIRELIEKDMSPEQKTQLKASEIEQRLEERLREYQHQMEALTGAMAEATADDPVTRRILCVVGKRVLAFDPTTNLHPEVPKEVHDMGEGGLGYLRSVRHQVMNGADVYFMGAQRGIYRVEGEQREEYTFPREPKGKGGANSACSFGGRVFATHSELGVVEWPIGESAGGRIVHEDLTDGKSSTRGALVGPDGRLYFSSGQAIHAVDTRDDSSVTFKGCEESITAFHVRDRSLLAGTKGGRILEWALDDPGSPREFPVKKKNAIYMLKTAVIGGVEYVVVGSKDYTVTLAAPEKELYREYRAKEEVRWVDGSGDFIAGISRSGYKLFVWEVQKPSEPKLTIRVSDKVQDLYLVKALKA